jgi:hypothetical protein
MLTRSSLTAISMLGLFAGPAWAAAQLAELPPPKVAEAPVEPLVASDLPLEYGDFVGTYFEDSSHVRIPGREWFVRFELLTGGGARWTASDDGRSTYEVNGTTSLADRRLRIDWESGDRNGRLVSVPEEETFIAMTWGARHYLLPEGRAEEFCRDVDAGYEPRALHHGIPLLRSDEWKLPTPGLPVLPMPWRAWLRTAAVEGRVVSVDGDGGWIDRGESSGLRGGDLLAVFELTARVPQQKLFPVEIVEVLPDRARVSCSPMWTENLEVGQWVSTLHAVNHHRLPVPVRSVKVPDRRLNRVPENRLVLAIEALEPRPGTEEAHPDWLETVQGFIGRDGSSLAAEGRSPRTELRASLDAVPIADLTPAILNEALRVPLSRPEPVRQTAALVAYWNERERGVHRVEFDPDEGRITPLALQERLQALYDWAEWWRATSADPTLLAEWTAAVHQAGGR